jgi:hypothetical protein
VRLAAPELHGMQPSDMVKTLRDFLSCVGPEMLMMTITVHRRMLPRWPLNINRAILEYRRVHNANTAKIRTAAFATEPKLWAYTVSMSDPTISTPRAQIHLRSVVGEPSHARRSYYMPYDTFELDRAIEWAPKELAIAALESRAREFKR